MKFRTWVAQTKILQDFQNSLIYSIGVTFSIFWFSSTGVATFCCYGKGNTVFNLLAHFIKGGYFSYGLLSLSRYCGGFTNKG